MKPANNATMFKSCKSTNAADEHAADDRDLRHLGAHPRAERSTPRLSRDLRSTLCAKYAVGTRLLIPPTSADSTAARPNGIDAAAAIAVSRHWTQNTRLNQRTDRSTVHAALTASEQVGLTAGPARRTSRAYTPLPHSPVADARLYGPRSRPINALRGTSTV